MTPYYALSNPICRIVEKNSDQFTRTDLINVIERKHIERITFHYTALDGKLKELKLPITSRAHAERILAEGERVDGSSLFKGMVDAGLSDLYVVPVYKTAFLNPFDESSLDFVCRYITPDGQLAPFALDNILHNAYELFKKNSGLELYALGELEFFLLSSLNDPMYHASKQKGYHASAPFVKNGPILNEMMKYIAQITGSVKYAHSEVGYVEHVFSHLEEIRGRQAEQLEIEFLPVPITDAADHLIVARWLMRNVAYKHGSVATFAPKIEEGVAGNGLHIHMELRKNGRNIMRDPAGNLSVEAKKLIGGLCTYADSLTAFGNTVASSYLRLVPDQEAPTRVCWSDLNRSAMIRVPLGWTQTHHLAKTVNPQETALSGNGTNGQTVELRTPDGSALIHPLLAGIALAVDWGLAHTESIDFAEKLYVKGNIFKDKNLLEQLPVIAKNCVESSKILHEKRKFYERESIFPPSVIDYMIKLLRAENDEILHKSLNDLPPDERLSETRKVLHKDLHRH
ncbi:glutamine synthetase [bacterium]|nr:glutamine synthetase [bacterium]